MVVACSPVGDVEPPARVEADQAAVAEFAYRPEQRRTQRTAGTLPRVQAGPGPLVESAPSWFARRPSLTRHPEAPRQRGHRLVGQARRCLGGSRFPNSQQAVQSGAQASVCVADTHVYRHQGLARIPGNQAHYRRSIPGHCSASQEGIYEAAGPRGAQPWQDQGQFVRLAARPLDGGSQEPPLSTLPVDVHADRKAPRR